MRQRYTLLLPLLLASIIAIGIGATQFKREADAAGAVLYHPSANCSGAPATVTMKWSPVPGTTSQHLEVSLLDNEFATGTFTRVNLSADQNTQTMAALAKDIPTYWRVVSSTGGGEVASPTKAFVACGAPFLLWGPLECRNYTSAAVKFRWAPAANYEGQQYIEFDSNGDWRGDDFWTAGPFGPAVETARRSGFLNDVGYLFRIVHEVGGERQVSSVGWFMPDCLPEINPNNYSTDDQLVIPAININAPVNIRDVGFDGVLGVPTGGYDVVKYNFAFFPHLQGDIAGPGPTLIGGHYDYHVIGPAVFWDLAKLKPGDVVEYWDGNVKYAFVVDWVAAVPYYQSLNSYLESADDDTLFLITCFGEFDRDQFGGYDQRTLVKTTQLN